MLVRRSMLLLFVVAACGEPLTTGTHDADRGVVGGTRTYDRPEIGYTGNCTATLIHPTIAITAAHCWGYGTRDRDGNYGWIRFDLGQNHSRYFDIVRYKSFGSRLGATDVTLLLLDEPVPSDLVSPAVLATAPPARGESIAIWGYGCTNQSRQVGGGVKRVVDLSYGATDNLCPGDSGGPATVGRDGAIWGINSYYGSSDGFGLPYQMLATLNAQIATWGVDVSQDAEPPVVEVLSPNDGDTRPESTTIEVSARITDDLALSRTELEWDFNGNTYGCPTNTQWVDCSVSGDVRTWTIQVGTGTRTFRVAALDVAGKRTVSVDRTITLVPPVRDTDPPVVTIISPDAGLEVPTQSTVNVVAEITDDSTLSEVGLIWDYNGETYACPSTSTYVDCTVSGTTYTWVVRLGRARDRPFRIRAVDAAGNPTETNTRTFSVLDISDQSPPAVAILSPEIGSTPIANSQIEVTARITDDIGVASASLDWSWYNDEVYPCPHTSTYVDCSIVGDEYRWLVRVGTGERRFTILATDGAGNETRTEELSFVLQ